jgi:hypothetical protein
MPSGIGCFVYTSKNHTPDTDTTDAKKVFPVLTLHTSNKTLYENFQVLSFDGFLAEYCQRTLWDFPPQPISIWTCL